MDGDSKIISLVPQEAPHRVVGERLVILSSLTLEIHTIRFIELESWALDGLNDPFWRLYLPNVGKAELWTGIGAERKTFQLVPGTAFLISPRTTISSTNPEFFSKWYVHFSLGQSGDRASPGVFPVNLTEQMQGVVDRLEGTKNAPFPWIAATLVAEALQQLPDEVWTKRQLDSRVERAMEFMHLNLTRKLTAEHVARAAGLSVRNLNHQFQQHVSMSPMRVLLDFRLDKACGLLRHSDDSIDQIAEDCGFPNRYYFSRMLKQHRGVSPAAYRRAEF